MSNYPLGAANDPRAPYNEPLTKWETMKVEVSADLGTVVEVEIEVDEDGYFDTENLRTIVSNRLRTKYGVDEKDTILNDIYIWDWRFK